MKIAMDTTRLRAILTIAGLVSLCLVAASIAMFVFAGAHGIHCPECDRVELGDRYEHWARFFGVKDGLLLIGGAGGVLSSVFATRRRWGIIAVALAVLVVMHTPN